jgi:hypothetical protein
MADDMDEAILLSVAPDALERARRLRYAMRLLRAGETPCHARYLLREQFQISRITAWRIVGMARDLTEGP